MSRLIFEQGGQKEFLSKTKERLGIDWPDMAVLCSINPRTFRDWRKEKYRINYAAARRLSKFAFLPIPETAVIKSEFWNNSDAGRKGARIAYELYGNPGTAEGRRAGGLKSAEFFKNNPELAKERGFVVRKEINYPDKSEELAEFVGVMLGDGNLPGNHQARITLNRESDAEYIRYVQNLIRKLFSVDSILVNKADSLGTDILVSSSNLVDYLVRLGLRTGNKVKNQVRVPKWIFEKEEYKITCLRGLMDTDGGLYHHKYYSGGKEYLYLKACFSNKSRPLLDFMYSTLKEKDFKVSLSGCHVEIYASSEVKKYFREIGSSNFKHINKFERFYN